MADLTASDVSVNTVRRTLDIGRRGLDKNMSIVPITFGDGSKTYPSGGIPLPAIGKFGFNRQIDFCQPQQPAGDGFLYKYDPDNHKLLIFTQGITTGSTAAAAAGNGALIEQSDGSEGTFRAPGTDVDETHDIGPMIELPNTVAPAETTLKLLLIGE